VQSGLVSNQTRAFAVDPNAQSCINSVYTTATFVGDVLGTAASRWTMSRYGWRGIVAFGIALGLIAAVLLALGRWKGAAAEGVALCLLKH